MGSAAPGRVRDTTPAACPADPNRARTTVAAGGRRTEPRMASSPAGSPSPTPTLDMATDGGGAAVGTSAASRSRGTGACQNLARDRQGGLAAYLLRRDPFRHRDGTTAVTGPGGSRWWIESGPNEVAVVRLRVDPGQRTKRAGVTSLRRERTLLDVGRGTNIGRTEEVRYRRQRAPAVVHGWRRRRDAGRCVAVAVRRAWWIRVNREGQGHRRRSSGIRRCSS